MKIYSFQLGFILANYVIIVNMPDKKPFKQKIKDFWGKYELKIVLVFGFLLVSAISFEFGLLQGQKWQQDPVIIETPVLAQNLSPESASGSAPEAQKTAPEAKNSLPSPTTPPANCVFVGSKNSNKYYPPTCQWAKRIKPENLVCFASAETASAKGYQPGKGCVK